MSNKPITVEQAAIPSLSNPYDAPIEYIHLEEAKAYLHGYNDGAKAGAQWKEQQMQEELGKDMELLDTLIQDGAFNSAAAHIHKLLTKYKK